MQQTLEVTVPPNVVAGQTISISAPTGQLMQVVVPPNLVAGNRFLVSVPSVPSVPMIVPMSDAFTQQASGLLAKLGPIGSHYCFEIRSAQVSRNTTTKLEGSMPMTSGGRTVATLMFQTAQKSQHVSAALVLPSGEVMATFERGSPPKTTAGGVLKSLAGDFRTKAAPPVAIELLGQPYGSFKAHGFRGNRRIGWMGGILDGTELRYLGSGPVASTAPQPRGGIGWKMDNPGGYKLTTSKKSSLGKKEAPLSVFFGNGGARTASADGVIHVVPSWVPFKGPGSYFAAHEVLCEPGKKQDVLLMGAAMAAIIATERPLSAGGM